MAIKLCVFDMGNVLIDESQVWPQVGKRFGLSIHNIRDLGPHATAAILQMVKSDMPEEVFWGEVEKDMEAPVSWNGVLHESYQCNELPLTRHLVSELISNGHRTVCGTNNIKPFYEKIKAGGFYDVFEKTYSSFLIGIAKPDPAFFRYIAREERVSPEEIFFVDDREENVNSAATLGILAHHFIDGRGLEIELKRQRLID